MNQTWNLLHIFIFIYLFNWELQSVISIFQSTHKHTYTHTFNTSAITVFKSVSTTNVCLTYFVSLHMWMMKVVDDYNDAVMLCTKCYNEMRTEYRAHGLWMVFNVRWTLNLNRFVSHVCVCVSIVSETTAMYRLPFTIIRHSAHR